MPLDVGAGAVGLPAACRVAEGDEELVSLVVRGQPDGAAAALEPQRAGSREVLDAPVARLDVLVLGRIRTRERCLEAHRRVGLVVAQAREGTALCLVERRIAALREELVLHTPQLADVHDCATAGQASAFPR